MDRVGPLISPILVGRDDLLALADRRIAAARGGNGELLFLAGEAGVGKTRLLGSIERRASALGFRTVRGGTYPGDLEVAGAVFVDLARAAARAPALGDLGERLSRLLARSPASDATAGDGGEAHRRRRVLTLDVAALLAEAGDRPTLIALEDLHWSDDLTLEIVATLAHRLPDLPLLVVATYRSDELYPRVPMRTWRARLLGQRLAEEARLRALGLADTAVMARLLLGAGEPIPRPLVEAIHRRTDGVPLHVEELIGVLEAARTPDADRVAPTDIEAAGVPDTLEEAVLGRIAHRSARARRVATVGAVIGRSFELDLLARVLDEDEERLTRPLAELAEHFFLAPLTSSGRYSFRHGLMCDAIYDHIPLPERRRLHARIADAAAAGGDFSDAFLSLQYERAGRSGEAWETALRAARAATTISAWREADDLYRRAVRHAPAGLSVPERAALEAEHAAAAAAADDNATAADAYERSAELWRSTGDAVAAARLAPALVAARHLLGDDLDARVARLEAALTSVTDLPPEPEVLGTRARLEAGLSSAYMLDRRLGPSIDHGRRAIDLARKADDPTPERNATVTVGACLVFAGEMDEGWGLLEGALDRSRDEHLEAETSRAFRMIGSCASVLVEYERAEAFLREGIAYAERVEHWNDRHYMAAHLAHVLWATGRWPEATSVAEHALSDGRGGITTRITALHVLGYLALGRGDWPAAEAALEEARVAGERMRELQRLSPALWGLAELALLRGDAAGAIAWAERGRDASAAVEDGAYLYPFLVTGVRACLAAADPAGAERWVERIEPAIRRRSIPGTLPAIDHAHGLLDLAAGRLGVARQRLKAAAEAWASRRRTWEGTWARLDLARAMARANRAAEAARELAEVERVARDLRSLPILDRAADVLRDSRRRRPSVEPWEPLTAREYEVARLVADGSTNAQIAAELGLSPRTVGAHVEHILGKLGAARRAEIAAWVTAIGPPAGAGEALSRR